MTRRNLITVTSNFREEVYGPCKVVCYVCELPSEKLQSSNSRLVNI